LHKILIILVLICFTYHKKKNTEVEKDISEHETKLIRQMAEREKAFKVTTEINAIILETLEFNLAVQKIANAIPQQLGYTTGVLALIDEKEQVLKRVAISETPGGEAALSNLEVPFSHIDISMSEV